MTEELPVTPDAPGIEPPPPLRVGVVLREARTQLGISLEEVSGRIKFAPRQIEALEAENFDELPETAFLRGFVRSYAKLLHLDAEPLLAALPHAAEPPPAPLEARALQDASFPNIYAERKQNILWLAAALAVAIVLGLTAWLFNHSEKSEATNTHAAAKTSTESTEMQMPEAVPVSAIPDMETAAPQAANPAAETRHAATPGTATEKNTPPAVPAQPVKPAENAKSPVAQAATAPLMAKPADKVAKPKDAGQPGAPAANPAAPQTKSAEKPKAAAQGAKMSIHLKFDQDSWVEITDKDGKPIVAQLNRAGSELTVANDNPPFKLLIGNAANVHLTYKGLAVDLAPHTKTDVAHLTLE